MMAVYWCQELLTSNDRYSGIFVDDAGPGSSGEGFSHRHFPHDRKRQLLTNPRHERQKPWACGVRANRMSTFLCRRGP